MLCVLLKYIECNASKLSIQIVLAVLLTGCGSNSDSQESEQLISTDDYNWPLRNGFPKPTVPASNPMTDEKVALGRYLFYDKNLSFNQQQACADCHRQEFAFSVNQSVMAGSSGDPGRRNPSTLVNIAYNKTLTWSHSNLKTIESQILIPMFGEDPVELGITNHQDEVLQRIKSASYATLFEQAFPQKDITFNEINQALASFVRSLISLDAPFDRYAYDGDDSALTESQINGMNLFFSEKFECHHCHGGFNFTQSTFHEKQLLDRKPFHNIGLYNVNNKNQYPEDDRGLEEITTLVKDNGRFRAPSLRNVAVSGPYMHDGSIETLEQVIEMYAAGGRVIKSGKLQGDGRINALKNPLVKGIDMTDQEKKDLLSFLQSLTDQKFLTNQDFSDPFKSAGR
ncbi:MAG: MbnH family di-heme enzyme [Kangiellaceae bacterium]|jgi:cytochrome c peroxidase|nr:MbnH family di-heme enzyme [Kangiellaceae bacterium]